MSKSKILVKMSGSIACYKACALLSKLAQNNYEVQVVASHSALKFIGAATLEGLTGKAVISDTFEAGNMMAHIHLMRWADQILVAPATAHFINMAARGSAEDLLHTMFLAHDFKKPYMIAPAMNTSMYLHPMTQESITKLKSLGIEILETASGVLACGEVGWGRLLEPDLLFQEIEKRKSLATFSSEQILNPVSKPKVLVTSGGTQEPIDNVRCITNKSTGRTGSVVAETLSKLGYEVTYLHAASAVLPSTEMNKVSFTDFNSLAVNLKILLSENDFTAVVHTAAVSDYSVLESVDGKMSSSQEQVTLTLKRNPKLIDQLKSWSKNKNLKVIGFKLTSKADETAVRSAITKILSSSKADLIIHNDSTEINNESHIFHIYNSQEKEINKVNNSQEMSQYVAQFLGGSHDLSP